MQPLKPIEIEEMLELAGFGQAAHAADLLVRDPMTVRNLEQVLEAMRRLVAHACWVTADSRELALKLAALRVVLTAAAGRCTTPR